MQRLINKDKAAFTFVFDSYYQLLVHYAARFLETIEEAEEVVQDVFVKFWEKCDQLEPDSSVKSYLHRSVHNTCLNLIKHQKVKDAYQQFVVHHLETSYDESSEQSDPEFIRTRIMEAIDELPPRCSEIFKLSRYEGLKYQEIADHLSISIKTVEVQMGKALKTLRLQLSDLKNVSK